MTRISGQTTRRPRMPTVAAARRGGLVALAAVVMLLIGAAGARAADLFIDTSRASAGDTVRFSISDTSAGDGYVITVADKEVASGNDEDGGGVSGRFDMPDLGNSTHKVSVEARVSTSGGDILSSRTIEYFVAASLGSGTTTKQPAGAFQPAPAGVAPSPSRRRSTQKPAASKPRTPTTRTPTTRTRTHTKQTPAIQRDPTPTPARGHAPSFDTGSTTRRHSTGNRSTGVRTRRATPAAGLGSTSKPTSSAGSPVKSASPAAVVSGSADISQGGLPVGLIVMFGLFVLAGIAAVAFRAAPHWRPWRAVPQGKAADDARLTALGRAASANAEWQRTIAQRRAARSGRAS